MQVQTLSSLLLGFQDGLGDKAQFIVPEALALDSRAVTPGALFFAVKGHGADGRNYLKQALGNGACAMIVEAQGLGQFSLPKASVPIVPIAHLSKQLGVIAQRFYQTQVPQSLTAVTGTNGKTSTAYFYAQWLGDKAKPCGYIGTLGYGIVRQGECAQTELTTPDPIAMQAILAHLQQQGCEDFVVEASSHALAQQRLRPLCVNTAIITHVSSDHIDYHGSCEQYLKDKLTILTLPGVQNVVLNRDCASFLSWQNHAPKQARLISYGLNSSADLWANEVAFNTEGIIAKLHYAGERRQVSLKAYGQFMLENAMAAMAAHLLSGYSFSELADHMQHLSPPPGRMELALLTGKKQIAVIIDYAHTEDGLCKALKAVRLHWPASSLTVVFGCGGNRDQSKRVLMGNVADRYADRIYLTNDNPRSENPMSITHMIAQGITSKPYEILLNRAEAIEQAIDYSPPGGVVLLAGKGHEQTITIGDHVHTFDEKSFVLERFA